MHNDKLTFSRALSGHIDQEDAVVSEEVVSVLCEIAKESVSSWAFSCVRQNYLLETRNPFLISRFRIKSKLVSKAVSDYKSKLSKNEDHKIRVRCPKGAEKGKNLPAQLILYKTEEALERYLEKRLTEKERVVFYEFSLDL